MPSLKAADNTGIGINNTKRRLDLLYDNLYALKIEDEAGKFTVHFKYSGIMLTCIAIDDELLRWKY